MVGYWILSHFLVVICDWIHIERLHTLVYSFLLTKHNPHGAKKIHDQQSKKDRITLVYIEEYAVYKKQFRFFQRLRIFYFAILIPQYIVIIIFNFLSVNNTIFLCWILGFLKFVLLIPIISQFKLGYKYITIYDRRSFDKDKRH